MQFIILDGNRASKNKTKYKKCDPKASENFEKIELFGTNFGHFGNAYWNYYNSLLSTHIFSWSAMAWHILSVSPCLKNLHFIISAFFRHLIFFIILSLSAGHRHILGLSLNSLCLHHCSRPFLPPTLSCQLINDKNWRENWIFMEFCVKISLFWEKCKNKDKIRTLLENKDKSYK